MSQVIVYTQPGCRPCTRVVQKMWDAGIDPEIVDISRDLVSKDYITRWLGAKSTPVIEADGFDPVIGYQPDKLKEIIGAFGS
jgi:glutaredoxin-like protein NrdH